jgi:hypothetical protein
MPLPAEGHMGRANHGSLSINTTFDADDYYHHLSIGCSVVVPIQALLYRFVVFPVQSFPP